MATFVELLAADGSLDDVAWAAAQGAISATDPAALLAVLAGDADTRSLPVADAVAVVRRLARKGPAAVEFTVDGDTRTRVAAAALKVSEPVSADEVYHQADGEFIGAALRRHLIAATDAAHAGSTGVTVLEMVTDFVGALDVTVPAAADLICALAGGTLTGDLLRRTMSGGTFFPIAAAAAALCATSEDVNVELVARLDTLPPSTAAAVVCALTFIDASDIVATTVPDLPAAHLVAAYQYVVELSGLDRVRELGTVNATRAVLLLLPAMHAAGAPLFGTGSIAELVAGPGTSTFTDDEIGELLAAAAVSPASVDELLDHVTLSGTWRRPIETFSLDMASPGLPAAVGVAALPEITASSWARDRLVAVVVAAAGTSQLQWTEQELTDAFAVNPQLDEWLIEDLPQLCVYNNCAFEDVPGWLVARSMRAAGLGRWLEMVPEVRAELAAAVAGQSVDRCTTALGLAANFHGTVRELLTVTAELAT